MDRIVGGDKRFVKPFSAAGFEAQTLSAKFLGNCLLIIQLQVVMRFYQASKFVDFYKKYKISYFAEPTTSGL
jgi:hypothetical protein